MAEMGIPMVCGSDCGWGYSPFGETHLELDAMAAAGLTPLQALATATGIAADALGRDDRIGRLRAGLTADLLVVDGNPGENILDLARVREVFLGGQPVYGTDPFYATGAH
jgi:imidazolonepropionase-like amidohydrolase